MFRTTAGTLDKMWLTAVLLLNLVSLTYSVTHYSSEEFPGLAGSTAATEHTFAINSTIAVGTKIRLVYEYTGTLSGDIWFRLYNDKYGVLHFRLILALHQMRFNQMRYGDDGVSKAWKGPWVSTLPTLQTGANIVEVYIEEDSWQCSFNGVRVELVEVMSVYQEDLGGVSSALLHVAPGNIEFGEGCAIMTPYTIEIDSTRDTASTSSCQFENLQHLHLREI